MTQEKILLTILKHGLSFSDIAREVGLTPQTLHYQLNVAKKFDVVLEQKILQALRKRGIIENNPDEGKMISDHLLEHLSLTNYQLSILTKTIKEIIDDDKIDENERQVALMRIKNFRIEFNESLDELEALINGETIIHLKQNFYR